MSLGYKGFSYQDSNIDYDEQLQTILLDRPLSNQYAHIGAWAKICGDTISTAKIMRK